MQKRTILIDRDEYERFQRILDAGKQVRSDVWVPLHKTYLVDFGGGIEADIQVCNGERPYVIGTLYNGDFEVATTDPSEELLGEYTFDHEGRIYVVEIQVKQEIKVKA